MSTFSIKAWAALLLIMLPCFFALFLPVVAALLVALACWYAACHIALSMIRDEQKEKQRTAGQAVRCHKGCANERTRPYYNIKK